MNKLQKIVSMKMISRILSKIEGNLGNFKDREDASETIKDRGISETINDREMGSQT